MHPAIHLVARYHTLALLHGWGNKQEGAKPCPKQRFSKGYPKVTGPAPEKKGQMERTLMRTRFCTCLIQNRYITENMTFLHSF